MKYIVNLSYKSKDIKEPDFELFQIEIDADEEEIAIGKAIDIFYEKKWTNSGWKKDEFELEMTKFKYKLALMSRDVLIGFIPNQDTIINEYENALRNHLGCTDKSLSDFKELFLFSKVNYLANIGCVLEYFAYPKGKKITKLK